MSEDLFTPPGGERNAGQEKSSQKQKAIFVGIAILIVVGLFFYLTFFFNNKPASEPTLKPPAVKEVSGDLAVAAGEIKTVENGDILKISGNLTVDGEIMCSGGGLFIEVAGDANINGQLTCERADDIPDADADSGIALVVGGALTMGENAKLETNGHVQLLDDASLLSTTRDQFSALYGEAAQDTGEGVRVGPFITKDMAATTTSFRPDNMNKTALVKAANAAGKDWTITGNLTVDTPPRWRQQITIVKFSNLHNLTIRNFSLLGPDGSNGQDDTGQNCAARGGNGQDALRFLVDVPDLKIDNFDLWLGSGGLGGNAFTRKDCFPGVATGGDGGQAGNFKLIGHDGIDIVGAFSIYPGKAGDGGSATAWGGDGESGKAGGDATAQGGNAENNEKAIRAQGSVNGTTLIAIDSMSGGFGGNASAYGGRGGDGLKDKSMDGGAGGNAKAVPGDGGDARIVLAGNGAVRTPGASDTGGDAGSVHDRGGRGGDGSVGSATIAGGNGGQGGDGIFSVGHAGVGGSANGNVTKVIEDNAGNGGSGGSGCKPGSGGAGGAGLNPGAPGFDGLNLCPPEEKKEDAPKGEEGAAPAAPPAGAGGALVNVDPASLTFEHKIGETACPTPVGSITITNAGAGAADGWKLVNGAPMWLYIPASGSLPGSAPVSFSCQLDQYVTQQLDTTLNFQLTENGQPVGDPGSVNVTGYITGQ